MTTDIQYVQLNNQITIAYTEAGKQHSHTLLFVHGLANYCRVWELNTIELQHHYRCIAIDLPGNGLSSRGNYTYDLDFFVTCIEQFVTQLQLQKVTLVGHSMGGQIVIKTALHKPIWLRHIILCASAGLEYYTPHEAVLFKSAITLGDFLNMDEMHIAQSIHTSFYSTSFITQKIIDDLKLLIQQNDRMQYRKMLEKCINAMLDDQVFHDLPQILIPVLIVFGEQDMLIPNRFLHPVSTTAIAQKAALQFPQATVLTFPQAGHFVQIEKATQVNESIQQWIKENQ